MMTGKETTALPMAFCWTRYGTEAGETIESILARKERERADNDGTFLWGIGNAVGSALSVMADVVAVPELLFSPIRGKPRAIDVGPSRVVTWRTAQHPDGSLHPIPASMTVRGRATVGGRLTAHYALICHSDRPLEVRAHGELDVSNLTNFLSGRPLGPSQVTAVVRRIGRARSQGTVYPVTLRVRLIAPFWVRLRDPIDMESIREGSSATLEELLGVA
jgi:hypothetical protein